MRTLWAAKWYLLLGLLCYLLVLAATAPLDFVWRQVKPGLPPLPVNVKQVSGTLWDGEAVVNVPRVGNLMADWTLSPVGLITGTADLELEIKGDELSFDGRVMASPSEIQIEQANGNISTRYLKPVLRQGRASLEGSFELSGLNAIYSVSDKRILDAGGRLIFSGGDVSFPIDGRKVNATLPILVGKLSQALENTELNLETDEGQAIGRGYLQPDGWGGIAIRRRFLDILGQKWPAEATEDTVIFEVSQKIL